MKTILHVGCGSQNILSMPSYFHDGTWGEIRFDIDPNVYPDIQGKLQDLSLINNSTIDALYSSHNIEHVSSFEVPIVLKEFRRVLNSDGFAMIRCPDIKSVAEAMFSGSIEDALYVSPAGPISALDIVYGHQIALQQGQIYMAHKTAFTAETLAKHLMSSGFSEVKIARDKIFGLHAIAFVKKPSQSYSRILSEAMFPAKEKIIESMVFSID